MSRRKDGLIEEILIGFAELPFWMSLVGAPFVYLLKLGRATGGMGRESGPSE